MIQVTYKLSAPDLPQRLRRIAKRFPETVDVGLRRAGRWAVASAELRTAWRDKVDTRRMIQAFTFSVRDHVLLVTNNAFHHQFVEKGRLPGTLPPVSVISAWAARKLGNAALGWPIAMKIKRDGIKPVPIITGPVYAKKLREIGLREVRKALEQELRRRGT